MRTKLCHRTSCNLNIYPLFLFINESYNIIKRFDFSSFSFSSPLSCCRIRGRSAADFAFLRKKDRAQPGLSVSMEFIVDPSNDSPCRSQPPPGVSKEQPPEIPRGNDLSLNLYKADLAPNLAGTDALRSLLRVSQHQIFAAGKSLMDPVEDIAPVRPVSSGGMT